MSKQSWLWALTTKQFALACVALVLVLVALGAAAAAILVPPQRVHEVRLVVGTRELSAQQVPYYSTATLSLAETYARYVTEALATGAEASISASVIAGTPVIRIQASASTDDASRKAVEQASIHLMTQVNAGGSENLERLRTAVVEASEEVAELKAARAALKAGASADRRVQAETRVRLAELRLVAASEAYRSAQLSNLNATTQLAVIQPAYSVTESLPKPILAGAIGGGVLGGLLSLAWFSLRAKRPTVG